MHNAGEASPSERAAGSVPQMPRRIMSALLPLIASILGMVLLGLIGFQRFQVSQREEQRTLQAEQAQQALAPRLYFGQRLPDLEVQVARVHPAAVRLSSFRGKWLALVLVSSN